MGGGGGDDVKETEGEKVMAAIAAEKYNHWRKTWRPIQDQYIKDVQVTDSDYAQRAGMANVDAQSAIGGMNPVQAGTQRGGNLATNINEGANLGGKVQGSAVMRSNMATDDAYQNALKSIVDVGVGKSAMASQGLMSSARSNLTQSATEAQSNFNSWSNRQNNLGSVAGMGAYQYTQGGGSSPKVAPQASRDGSGNQYTDRSGYA